MIHVDAAIIGFGKGGKTLAGALAAAGKSVAMIERSSGMYGGTCINVACIPTKSLVHSAALSTVQGGTFADKAARYRQAIGRKNFVTSTLRGKNYHKLADNPNIEVLTGEASFIDSHRLGVMMTDGTKTTLEAKWIFINTGAAPFVPPVPGLKESKFFYTSDSLMELTRLPERMVIIGGGYIGMEFASMFTNFGSQVTVVQNEAAFLPREDAEIAQAVFESLTARGIRLIRSAKVQDVRDDDGKAIVAVETAEGVEHLAAEAVLVATGRRPSVAGLNLEAAGVALTDRGAIRTDEHLKTTAPDVWAMGDVAGGLQFTYISLDDYRIVASQLLGDGSRTTANRGAVPYSVFIDPPFSRVGMSEQEALEKGYEIKVAKLPVVAIPKALVLNDQTGLLKAVVDAKTSLILGAHFFCEESHEMINLVKLAIDAELPYQTLKNAIYTHPTMSEALNDLFASLQ